MPAQIQARRQRQPWAEITIRVTPDIADTLTVIARRDGRTRAGLLRWLAVRCAEDHEHWQHAAKRGDLRRRDPPGRPNTPASGRGRYLLKPKSKAARMRSAPLLLNSTSTAKRTMRFSVNDISRNVPQGQRPSYRPTR
jgi:hypothetical protein